MAYATQAQIEIAAGGSARLIQICDQDGNGALDAAALAQAQLQADMLIDGHSRMRYAELVDALDAPTNTAIALAAQETVYQLKCMIGQNSANDDNLAAARLLIYEKIANGTFRPAEPLPAATDSDASEYVFRDTEGEGTNEDDQPSIGRESLKGLLW